MAGQTKVANIDSHVREIDFVSRFGKNVQALLDILGISRPIKKVPGTKLVGTVADIVLESGLVEEGATIPMSVANVHDVEYGDVVIEKYAKEVTMEAIAKHGAAKAIDMTDNAMLTRLQNVVCDRFYTFLKTGTLTRTVGSFQMALALAQGYVRDMWKAMDKDITEIAAFVNTIDAFEYLGAAEITTQTAFGMTYIENFMGYRLVFLCDSTRIPRGKVLATPVENLVVYYLDPSDADFAKGDLNYTVVGDTPFIGVHTQGRYENATSDIFAIMGLYLFAEYINGIANVTFQTGGSLGAVTVASEAGTAVGDSKVTVTYTKGVGEKLYYKEGNAALTPTYLAQVDLTGWKEIATGSTNFESLTSGNVITVISVNGTGQAVASGYATIVVKES